MTGLSQTFSAVFAQRWRGFRTVNLWACLVALGLALGVYAFKADAGKESAQIREIDQQIQAERKSVTLLRAEVAHLEQPQRLERLSVAYLGLQPQDARKEAAVDGLTELSHHAADAAPKLLAEKPTTIVAPAPEPAR